MINTVSTYVASYKYKSASGTDGTLTMDGVTALAANLINPVTNVLLTQIALAISKGFQPIIFAGKATSLVHGGRGFW